MLKRMFLFALIMLGGIVSANAATIFMPGVSGIRDEVDEGSLSGKKDACLTEVSNGTMHSNDSSIVPYWDCVMAYPINLPVGSTIDGIEVAYRSEILNAQVGGRTFVAYLVENRLKPDMGVIPVAGCNLVQNPPPGQNFTNMGQISVPILNGSTYYVYVKTHNMMEISYVAVTYH